MSENELKANVLDIIRGTTVDGPGFRTSIYFAGCRHACPGCHNPQSWDFAAGNAMTIAEILEIVKEEDFDVTLSGGDPIYHLGFIVPLCREIKTAGYGIWLYTGFEIEQLIDNPLFMELTEYIEAIVDSPFMEAEKDESVPFKGSRNQRIISFR